MKYRLLIVIIMYTFQVNCQEFKFQHLKVNHGLSQSWVKCIYQDKFGFIWIGTHNGLNRFDGYSFKVYKNNSSEKSISHSSINQIFEDEHGNLWVGTKRGLNLYDRNKDKFKQKYLPDKYISCISQIAKNQILVGSITAIFSIDISNSCIREFKYDYYIHDLHIDQNKNLWVATSNGIWLMDTNTFSYLAFRHEENNSKSISSNDIRVIYEDFENNIWLGTGNNGLSMLKYSNSSHPSPYFVNFISNPLKSESISAGAVLSILDDKNGNLWIGTENGGLNILDIKNLDLVKPSFTHYWHNSVDDYSISSNSIYSIFMDDQNTIWIGTYNEGVNKYSNQLQKFKHKYSLLNKESINNNQVNVIYNEEDQLWIGTEGGLNRINKNQNSIDYFNRDPKDKSSISSNSISVIFRDSRKNLWIGTWSSGLNIFIEQSNQFINFQHSEPMILGASENNVSDILEDTSGYLWFSFMGGGVSMYDYKTAKVIRYTFQDDGRGLSNNWVMDIIEVNNAEIWIATTDAVDVINKKTRTIHSFKHDPTDFNSLSSNGATVLFSDSKNGLWVGTEKGMNYFNREDSTFIRYGIMHGMTSEVVKCICEDDHGNLWISTNDGISQFIDAISLPSNPVFKNYDVADGLQGKEFNINACSKDEDGNIYFGGSNGYNVFHPDSLPVNPLEPKVAITNFLVFNKPFKIRSEGSPDLLNISVADDIILTHKQTVFTIEFAALSYIAPEMNEYAYQLEGFEQEWNYVGNQRTATYTNLDAGKYVFRVKASNNDGLWNEMGASLFIEILNPWWYSIWAKLVYILLLIFGLYLFRKYTLISVDFKNQLWREHLEKEKSDELNQMKFDFISNISHELRTPLTLISGPFNKVLEKSANASDLKMIKRNIANIRNLVDQVLDIQKIDIKDQLNLKQVDIVACIKHVILDFTFLIRKKKISFLFLSDYCCLTIETDEDKVKKIVTNLVANALKYTKETGEVRVVIKLKPRIESKGIIVLIKVEDTGIGIPIENLDRIFDRFFTQSKQKNVSGFGIGLHLTKRMVKILGGNISVKSKIDKGSTFLVEIPISKFEPIPEKKTIVINGITVDSDKIELSDKINRAEQLSIDAKNVLVIDDNYEMCEYIDRTLSDDYYVTTETNPERGIHLALKTFPDLIVSDVMMPDINGFQLCKQLKTNIRSSHIPIILLTAKSTDTDHIEGLEKGADAYISKPFNSELLKTRVKNLIQQRDELRKYYLGSDGTINTDIKTNSLDRAFLVKISSDIKENYQNSEYNVNSIIQNSGMSKSVFYTKLKALTDESLNDLIRNYRLRKSKELLLQTSMTISEIAYETGFNTPTYFSSTFKEKYNISPREFKGLPSNLKE